MPDLREREGQLVELSLPCIAGFFGGEGSIGIYMNGQGRGRTLRVQITQNVTPQSTMMLTAIRERWGGSPCPFASSTPSTRS
jgi:hypothetical protein